MTNGDAAVEKRNFEAHPALRAVCDKRHPPVAVPQEGSHRRLPRGRWRRTEQGDPVDKATGSSASSSTPSTTGLSSAQQIRDDWTINRISPLGDAAQAGPRLGPGGDSGQRPRPCLASARRPQASPRKRGAGGGPNSGDARGRGDRHLGEPGARRGETATPSSSRGPRRSTTSGSRTATTGEPRRRRWSAPLVILTRQEQRLLGPVSLRIPEARMVVLGSARHGARSRSRCGHAGSAESAPSPVRRHARGTGGARRTQPMKPPARDPGERTGSSDCFASQAYKDQKEHVRRHAPEDDARATQPGGAGCQRRHHDPCCLRQGGGSACRHAWTA